MLPFVSLSFIVSEIFNLGIAHAVIYTFDVMVAFISIAFPLGYISFVLVKIELFVLYS